MFDRKKLIGPLFSTGGLIAVLCILIAVNILFSSAALRLDLTRDGQYSLSESSKKIIAGVKEDVTFKVFYTQSAPDMPVYIKNYAGRVIDFLQEYERRGKGAVKLEIYDPSPDSEEEEWARRYGIKLFELPSGGSMALGLAVMSADREEVLPFMDPSEETRLEYAVTRMIARTASSGKKTVGVVSSLPVFGVKPGPGAPPGSPGSTPWMFVTELKKNYDVIEISPFGEKIPGGVDILMLINPAGIGGTMIRAIARHVSKGVNVLAFTDPLPLAQANASAPGGASPFDDVLKSWGVWMKPDQIVADFNHSTRLTLGGGRQETNPLWLSLDAGAFNRENILTSKLESVILATAGAFQKAGEGDFEYEPLIRSSVNASLMEKFQARLGAESIRRAFSPGGESLDLAVRVRGRFPAFPTGPAEKDADDPSKTADIILVGDSDMLYDHYYMQKQNFLGFEVARIFNDNLNFLLNAVEMLGGDDRLIDIRSRGEFKKPFDRVIEIEDRAKMQWLDRERELIRKVEELNEKLSAMEARKNPSQRLIISESQEFEIKKFKERRRKINQELKMVRRNLRSDIESLGRKVKFFNIFLPPILVGIGGLWFGLARRRKMTTS
ncbi:conserved hypothetical protein [Candidatus Desulfarcum epimagneticum]|uniref:Uncharacterized protein n=1 Tax=uncultured Desulfobacteraceae bacterium TaxID=218296 RepID=A0A484HB50_9BACT|nr:conserved hypothetical protein [uncultured Desulfobacteraceae bacterium]